mmetsp:Transcript_14259/g.36793  ORF Transcript_14259/g.36793 Transcript_14259/m.36793 type:complete len:261 (+) Transcript_14259:1246-2028(+)
MHRFCCRAQKTAPHGCGTCTPSPTSLRTRGTCTPCGALPLARLATILPLLHMTALRGCGVPTTPTHCAFWLATCRMSTRSAFTPTQTMWPQARATGRAACGMFRQETAFVSSKDTRIPCTRLHFPTTGSIWFLEATIAASCSGILAQERKCKRLGAIPTQSTQSVSVARARLSHLVVPTIASASGMLLHTSPRPKSRRRVRVLSQRSRRLSMVSNWASMLRKTLQFSRLCLRARIFFSLVGLWCERHRNGTVKYDLNLPR